MQKLSVESLNVDKHKNHIHKLSHDCFVFTPDCTCFALSIELL